MGSRARIAAAACLVASGLLVGGAGAATALADTGTAGGSDDTPDSRTQKEPRRDRPSGDADSAAGKQADPPSDVSTGGDARKPRVEVKTRSGRPAGEEPEEPGQENPRPPCCEGGGKDCGPGWPSPDAPTGPPTYDGEYGENRPETLPPVFPMPPMGQGPEVLDTVPGIGAGADDATEAPITVPIIITRPAAVAPPAGPGAAAGPAPGGVGAGSAAAPRQAPGPPTPRQPLPEATGSSVAMPGSAYRMGYAEHLRGAGITQLAALALPGVAGILILTGAGGLVGYRQAKAIQRVPPSGTARFMN